MKRDWLRKQLGEDVSDDVIEAIMAQNGSDINNAKAPGDELKSQLSALEQRNKELEEAANAKLTDEEKWQKQLDEANARADEAAQELSKTSAVAVFAAAGLTEDDYKDFLPSIVGADRDATVKSAQAIAAMVKAKVDAAEKAGAKAGMAGMGAPAAGDPANGKPATKAEFMALPYEQKLKLKADDPNILNELK